MLVLGRWGVPDLDDLLVGPGWETPCCAQAGLACYRGGVITARGRRW